jgi:hypothetical protein
MWVLVSSLLQNFWSGYHNTSDAFIPLANLVFGPIFQILVSNITWFLGNTTC